MVLSATSPILAPPLVLVASPQVNRVPTLAMNPLAAAAGQTLKPNNAVQQWAKPVRRTLIAASLDTHAEAIISAVGALAWGATQIIVIQTKIVAMTCCVGG